MKSPIELLTEFQNTDRKRKDFDVSLTELAKASKWPEPLSSHAFIGPIGDLVREIEPKSEADSAALLFQLLAFSGSCMGRGSYFEVEGGKQYPNIFTLIVGRSSKARKGTSLGRVLQVFSDVDADFLKFNKVSGLSSGEGIVARVRDPKIEKQEDGDGNPIEKTIDPGVTDKRLIVVESEFGSALQSMRRDGNKLSAILRDAFDGSDLSILTRASALRATSPHISIVGHITLEELLKLLGHVDILNGFGNRFLYVAAQRSKTIPLGRQLDMAALRSIVQELSLGIEFGINGKQISFDSEAEQMYTKVYNALDENRGGLFGTLTSRAEVMIIRLSLIYALQSRCKEIGVPHLKAAIACWQYAEDSVRCFFGESTGNSVADRILDELRLNPEGLSQTEIVRTLFRGHISKSVLGIALKHLETTGRAFFRKTANGLGRPTISWHLSDPEGCERSELSEQSHEPGGLNSLLSLNSQGST